ncbi:Glycyl-tRNA synthetase, partial [hydrothermal vent metagenome]
METLVALCKRRGFMFQSSDIYGGLKGFWDYGPLGVELKRNVREAWYRDMITNHNELVTLPGAPSSFSMVSVETSIIMHPQVWKCSGHYDLFHDFMVDCKSCKSRFRADHLQVAVAFEGETPLACTSFMYDVETGGLSKGKTKKLMGAGKEIVIKNYTLNDYAPAMAKLGVEELSKKLIPHCPECNGDLTDAREFNLMFKTIVGALATEEEGTAFLRPETAQGMFVNFKNVVDSSRVKIPFGIAQIGKSFRNEITPRNYTFRSREFEQMEMEFFCHPDESPQWYTYWRDRRFQWYQDLGISVDNLIMREHTQDEMAHYSVGTADVEYAFPFLDEGEYGELEGVAHRGDFDLRSHSEGKLINQDGKLVVELNDDGKPKYKGSGKDLSYFNDQTRERFIPHV